MGAEQYFLQLLALSVATERTVELVKVTLLNQSWSESFKKGVMLLLTISVGAVYVISTDVISTSPFDSLSDLMKTVISVSLISVGSPSINSILDFIRSKSKQG